MSKIFSVRQIALFWQDAQASGGNPGWAYNVIDTDGQHTSGGIEVGASDDGSEALADVQAAFEADFPTAATQVADWTWRANPDGGWICRA